MVSLPLASRVSPLRADKSGAVRVGKTRVTLDTLVAAYQDGSTAEEIVQEYPTLGLADVHGAIAFYLSHRAKVEAYLKERRRDADELRRQAKGISDQRGIRERLVARQAARKNGK